MIVADTDVLIDALAGREPAAGRVAHGLESRRLATTAVTAFELLSGARSSRQQRVVGTLLEALPILDLDEKASRSAAELRRRLEGRGESIGMADYLIAGICLVRSASLMTRNRKHFERVHGLRQVFPVRPGQIEVIDRANRGGRPRGIEYRFECRRQGGFATALAAADADDPGV